MLASHLHCCSWTGLLHCAFFPGVVGLVRSVLSGNSLGPVFKVLPTFHWHPRGSMPCVCVYHVCVVMLLWSCKSTCSESAQKWHGHLEDAIWKSKLSLPNLPWHSTRFSHKPGNSDIGCFTSNLSPSCWGINWLRHNFLDIKLSNLKLTVTLRPLRMNP